MGNEIPLQLAQFLRAILLGSILALGYDFMRTLHCLGGKIWATTLDILVSLSATLSIFLFVMAEEGELRLFLLLGTLGGAVLFFSLLSSILRPIWAFWVDLFLFPLHLLEALLGKLAIFFKKAFSFIRKWATITDTSEQDDVKEEQAYGEEKEEIVENMP